MINRTVPTATAVEESSNSEDLPVASVRLIGRSFVSTMDRSQDNRTENGAPAVTGGVDGTALTAQRELGDGLLALLTDAFGSDTRGKSRQTVKSFISRFIDEMDDSNRTRALELLACYIFNLRDIRGGKGERDLAFWAMCELAAELPSLFRSILPLFVREYGSFGDLLGLYRAVENDVPELYEYVVSFREAIVHVSASSLTDDSGTLAGKWAPRHQTSEKRNRTRSARLKNIMAREVAKQYVALTRHGNHDFSNPATLRFALKHYRKRVEELTRRAGVVEQKMSSNDWENIEPSKVPSVCAKKHRLAFRNKTKTGGERSSTEGRRKCAENFEEAIKKCIETGEGIKGSVSGAHGIVKEYMRIRYTVGGGEKDDMLEAMWKNLLKEAKEKLSEGGGLPSCVALVDVSGSMSGIPMEVAVALGLVIAEVAPPAWQNRVLTFESEPRWHQIVGDSLFERINNLMSAPWGGSTNFGKALNMILDFAVGKQLPREAMPEVLFVFSDMQFDTADGTGSSYGGTHHYREGARSNTGFAHTSANIRRAFQEAGYEMPTIVFWNLNGRCSARPCETITEGVFQMSGYSEAMLTAFMEGRLTQMQGKTPTDLMLEVLNGERYERVRAIVRAGPGVPIQNPEEEGKSDS
jgi:hypothetical protein